LVLKINEVRRGVLELCPFSKIGKMVHVVREMEMFGYKNLPKKEYLSERGKIHL
jgi:hypothetical protein